MALYRAILKEFLSADGVVVRKEVSRGQFGVSSWVVYLVALKDESEVNLSAVT